MARANPMRPSLVILLCAWTIAACRIGGIDTPDLVGTWVNPDGAEILLRDDGRFVVHRLPQTMQESAPAGARFDGAGAWQIVGSSGSGQLRLLFDRSSAWPEGLDLTMSAARWPSLSIWILDEEAKSGRYSFELRRTP